MTDMKQLRVVDLFAGAGGMSTGAKMAGAKVVWAANHWPEAVAIHSANHPEAHHICQDLHQADWRKVPRHDLILASPECRGHTNARGAERKAHDTSRSTAYAILGCVDHHRPPFLLVENVPEFTRWDGYRGWKLSLEDFGYSLTENVLNAADYGVPQSRERLFILGRHRGTGLLLSHPGRKHVAAHTILDRQSDKWTWVDRPGRSEKTLLQVEEGRKRHGKDFLIAYYGSERFGRSLDLPLGTITTRDRFALIRGNQMRMLTVSELKRAMAFPKDYILPPQHKLAVHMLGNAVCPPVIRETVQTIMAVA
jgi:DNA (cytosine-5)-methyltransferase 1